MSRIALPVALVAFGIAFPIATVRAQATPDSLPFRAGQWGAEFLLSDYTAVGALRFRTASQATVVNVAASLQRRDGSETTDSGTERIMARVGSRWYAPLASSVARFHGFGVLGGYDRQTFEERGEASASRTTFDAGLYGELGAQWAVTPRLALGAAWTASATYGRTSARNESNGPVFVQPDMNANVFTLNVGQASLRASLFF
jgi:hypothetical protein